MRVRDRGHRASAEVVVRGFDAAEAVLCGVPGEMGGVLRIWVVCVDELVVLS